MRPHSSAVTLLILLLPASGCCTISLGLSAIFCGPRTPLPRRSHFTPELALNTFVAGIATDDSETIWRTLGPDWTKQNELGRIEFEIGWKRIKEEMFGIHLVHRAKRSDPEILPATATRNFTLVRYRLKLAGTTIVVDLRQYSYREVTTLLKGMSNPVAAGDFVPDIGELMTIKKLKNNKTQLTIRIPGPDGETVLSDVLEAKVGREWLIYDFSVTQN